MGYEKSASKEADFLRKEREMSYFFGLGFLPNENVVVMPPRKRVLFRQDDEKRKIDGSALKIG